MHYGKFIAVTALLASVVSVWGCASEPLPPTPVMEQKNVTIGEDLPFVEGEHFQQGTNTDPDGRELGLNNQFLRYDGAPILPVMGEFHFSRYPKAEWEEAILKMKASGINIIASYCFWLHHEEEEGTMRFDDNRDVRAFIELCGKHGLWVFPRIGPWVHGECRNGGFPDWYAAKLTSPWDRGYIDALDPAVERWYRALAEQFEGLYFKDGGPIIGIQVDNEAQSGGPGDWGYEYHSDLRNYAMEVGMDVPLYTATGWPGPRLPEDLLMGLYGAYPAAPWTQNTRKLSPQGSFLFTPARRNSAIGSDMGMRNETENPAAAFRHPLLTVEMGGGNQITYHRRPRFIGADMLALVYTRVGVGANMIGYYIYHGTQHPLSWNSEFPTQESKTSIHPYPNDYPMISYDFEAPLTEWGFIREYYHDFKLYHNFINDFGSDLAPMYPVIPEDNPTARADSLDLRYAVRSRNGGGYVFFSNYVRQLDMADHEGVQFTIHLPDEELRIPDDGGISIKSGVYGILPFNYDMDGTLLEYATAHPFMIVDNGTKSYFFYTIDGVEPQFKFEKSSISDIDVHGGRKTTGDDFVKVSQMEPGMDCTIDIRTSSGEQISILLLTEEQARHSYKFDMDGTQTLLVTENMAFYHDDTDELEIRSMGENEFDVFAYPGLSVSSDVMRAKGKDGRFYRYHIALPTVNVPEIAYRDVSDHAAFDAYCESLEGMTPEGPTYSHLYDADAPYLVYEIEMPASLPEGANDLLLEFDYRGNTAEVYADGVIIADDYYSGVSMPFALRRHQDKLEGSTFLFQVTPLMQDYAIYFEDDTELGFKDDEHAGLQRITVVPEYAVKLAPQ